MIIWYLIKIEEIFSFMPKHFGHIGKIQMLKKFQAVQEFVCCLITLGRLYGLNKIFLSCPQFWVLSHMKEIMLKRTRLEILVNMRRYFNHFKSGEGLDLGPFICKVELGFFHFLERVTGWLAPSTDKKIPVQPGWYLPLKIPLAEYRFLQAVKGAENTKEKIQAVLYSMYALERLK
jgi:hypothetical protein